MAERQPTSIFTIESLNAIGARLHAHADAITNAVVDLRFAAAKCDKAVADLTLAAAVCDTLASLRFRIAEIAAKAIDHQEWDNASIARDLREALAKAEGGEDLPEPSRASHYS